MKQVFIRKTGAMFWKISPFYFYCWDIEIEKNFLLFSILFYIRWVMALNIEKLNEYNCIVPKIEYYKTQKWLLNSALKNKGFLINFIKFNISS
jgi:hypothetical protein